MPLVIAVALPPVAGIVYRWPSRSNTIVWPSGETASGIQVPFDVVKAWVRAVLSGSAPPPFPVESGRAAGPWAARGTARASSRREERRVARRRRIGRDLERVVVNPAKFADRTGFAP